MKGSGACLDFALHCRLSGDHYIVVQDWRPSLYNCIQLARIVELDEWLKIK